MPQHTDFGVSQKEIGRFLLVVAENAPRRCDLWVNGAGACSTTGRLSLLLVRIDYTVAS